MLPDTEVEFRVDGNVAILSKAEGVLRRGRRLVDVMRGRATVKMSTDEIMAMTRGE